MDAVRLSSFFKLFLLNSFYLPDYVTMLEKKEKEKRLKVVSIRIVRK